MLLLVPLLVATLIALLYGGSLRNLAELPIRGAGFLFGSLALQLLLYAPGIRDAGLVLQFAGVVYVCALGLVMLGAVQNWRLGLAVRVAITGLALNVMVIVLNGGHMPVDAAAIAMVQGQAKAQELAGQQVYDNTSLSTSSSKLTIFGDVIPVRLGSLGGNVYSPGDVLLATGGAAAAYGAVRRPFKPEQERSLEPIR